MAQNIAGSLGGTAGQMVGTYYGGPIGGYLGQYTGSILGNYLGDEAGLEDTSGGTVDEWGQGGGGAGDMFGSLFGGGGGGGGGGGANGAFRFKPISTQDLFSQAGGMLPQLAGYEVAYNQALQPGLTGVQLNAEQQIAPGTFDLRRDALAARQRDLDLGYRLPPELLDLVTTNALQGLTSSGAGASNLGMLFGARSLAGAGLDRGEARIANALAASQFRPDYFTPRQPFGSDPGLSIAADIRGVEKFGADLDFLNQERAAASSQKQSDTFTSLLGTAASMYGSGGGGMGGGSGGMDYSKLFKTGSAIGGAQYGIGGATTGGSAYNWNQSSGSTLGGSAWSQPYSFR